MKFGASVLVLNLIFYLFLCVANILMFAREERKIITDICIELFVQQYKFLTTYIFTEFFS